MAPSDTRPQIDIAKIHIKGWVGLVFAIGVMALFLIAVPAIRWLFFLRVPLGVLIGVVLHFRHRRG